MLCELFLGPADGRTLNAPPGTFTIVVPVECEQSVAQQPHSHPHYYDITDTMTPAGRRFVHRSTP